VKGVAITACASLVTAAAVAPFRARTDSLKPQDTSVTSTVDALFAEWTKPDSPGCGVGVARKGAVVYERGYGLANVEARIPITPASVFHVASISKQFTAMSVLLLAQRGQLSLDDGVRTHVPGWADSSRLTIRHLLTHTGGVRDAFMLRELAAARDEGSSLNDSLVSLLARQRALNFPPGAEFQYSNSGYVLLAGIVKRVSGQSLRAFADANIFKPLGMTQTHVHDDPGMSVANRATGYHRGERGIRPIPHTDLGRLVGTTGILTTVRDLLIWQQNLAEVRVGDPALVAAMQRPTPLTDGGSSPYGFGLEIGEDHGAPTVGHGGGDPGYGAYIVRYPDHALAVAVLCNLDNIGAVVGGLARAVARVYLADALKPSSTSGAIATPTPVTLSARQLAGKAGLYRDPKDGTFGRIFVRGRSLVAVAGADERGDSVELTALSASRFVIQGTPFEFEFVADARGQAREVHIAGQGPAPVVMRKVPPFRPSRRSLRAFAGTYTSPELDVTYRVTARVSRLVFQLPGRADVVVEPIFPDTFNGTLVNVVTFVRDARGTIVGFTLSSSGVRSLRFDRVNEPGSQSLKPAALH
jgi:CubicO group peptidase (beta-lactamase class C family)